MMQDPIADMLSSIKNAKTVQKRHVVVPYSKMKHSIATLLAKEGYIQDVEAKGSVPKKVLNLTLRYKDEKSVIRGIKRVSKSGLRVYVKSEEIPYVFGGAGISILSTPIGIMTGKQARKQKVGGEVLCQIW